MSKWSSSNDLMVVQANVLDHSREFVDIVHSQAPAEYRALLASERYAAALEEDNSFNHGKLYAYAEFAVFRREFQLRFPDATAAAAINAFSSLLLKNDISISNLVEFMEGSDDRRQLLMNQPPA